MSAAWRQSSHWIGDGWVNCQLFRAISGIGFGLDEAMVLRGAIPISFFGLDGAVVCCLAPIQSLDWVWLVLFYVAWPQSSHWTGPGWGCTLRCANPVIGLGLDGAVAPCLAPIQSLDWAWLGLLYAAWPQSSHWTGPGRGCCTLLGANPVTGLGLDGAVVRCLAPTQSLDWAWLGLFYAAWRQSNHWTGPG